MRGILEIQLAGGLSRVSFIQTHVGAKVIGIDAVEALAGPATVRIWLEADVERDLCWRKFCWVAPGQGLPDAPAKHIGYITPGAACLHLYEVMSGPTKAELADLRKGDRE